MTTETTTTTTWTLKQGVGYSGKHGDKAYVARIVGTSDRYGFEREFLDADKVERDHFNRPKYTRTFTFFVTPGLYELSAGGERWYRIVFLVDGAAKWTKVDADRAEAIARLLTDGLEYEYARLKTKSPTA